MDSKPKKRQRKHIVKSRMTEGFFKSKLKELGYSKADFARFVGIDEQTARAWRTGDIPIYAERAIELVVLRAAIEQANVPLEKTY